jgi:ankyrin repeat protein
VTRLDTVTLQRLLTAPGFNVNICATGQSPLSVVATHGRVKTIAMLLKVKGVEINRRGLTDLPICRAAARGHREVAKLLVQ